MSGKRTINERTSGKKQQKPDDSIRGAGGRPDEDAPDKAPPGPAPDEKVASNDSKNA